jgi:hypothetical protein
MSWTKYPNGYLACLDKISNTPIAKHIPVEKGQVVAFFGQMAAFRQCESDWCEPSGESALNY